METKEQRTEWVSLYVTPSLKRDLDEAGSNESLKEKILRNYITSEESFLKGQMQEIDELVIRYKAKLIHIKDNFEQAQNIYEEEIQKLIELSESKVRIFHQNHEDISEKVKDLSVQVSEINNRLEGLPLYRLEKLIDLVNKFNDMSAEDKQALKILTENLK